jgi:putative polymerase
MRPHSIARATAMAFVLASCCYAALLCFLNTRVMHVSETMFALVDAAIVLGALALSLPNGSRWLWILLTALVANFLFVSLVTEDLELKSVRDALVLVAFVALGWRWGDASSSTRIFLLIGAVVLVFALFEFIAPAAYVSFFDVIDFYRARGVVSIESVENLDSAFFISSAREGSRLLLPFLGDHRVSSIFLEPVSMGNFGALTLLFALSLDRQHWRAAAALVLIAVAAIILADARFASMIAPLLLAVRFFPLRWSTLALALLPALAIAILIGFALSDIGAGDDLATRLAGSGRVLLSMSPQAVFGMGGYDIVTYDAGYAYALSAFGLPFCIILWMAFVSLPAADRQGQLYKLLMGLYICALLCISGTSVFALKTAGLGFFALGALSRAHGYGWVRAGARVPPVAHGVPA